MVRRRWRGRGYEYVLILQWFCSEFRGFRDPEDEIIGRGYGNSFHYVITKGPFAGSLCQIR